MIMVMQTILPMMGQRHILHNHIDLEPGGGLWTLKFYLAYFNAPQQISNRHTGGRI